MKQLTTAQVWILSVALVCAICWMTADDFEARTAAESHAKHSLQLAQRDEAEKKAEFEYLAKKATYMTGVAVTGK
jgi:hypothetical protein